MSINLVIGENAWLTRGLKQSDGVTDLQLSDVRQITATLQQDDVVKKTWIYESDDDDWTEGFRQVSGTEVEMEIEVETTAALEVGEVVMRWDIYVHNSNFFVSNRERSIVDEIVLNVIESSLDEES